MESSAELDVVVVVSAALSVVEVRAVEVDGMVLESTSEEVEESEEVDSVSVVVLVKVGVVYIVVVLTTSSEVVVAEIELNVEVVMSLTELELEDLIQSSQMLAPGYGSAGQVHSVAEESSEDEESSWAETP